MKLNRKIRPGLARRLLSLSLLMGVCATMLPLPVSIFSSESSQKDSSEPFPCQDRPCGCQSAEQCWKKCCCFNNAQKIAWAKASGVKVPDFVLAAAKKENGTAIAQEIRSNADTQNERSVPAKATCCTQRPTCCSSGDQAASVAQKSSCCEKATPVLTNAKSLDWNSDLKSGCCSKCSEVAETPVARTWRTKWVMAICAAECQGLTLSAFSLPASILPERIVVLTTSIAMIETCSVESERLHPTSLRPPLPPPKLA